MIWRSCTNYLTLLPGIKVWNEQESAVNVVNTEHSFIKDNEPAVIDHREIKSDM